MSEWAFLTNHALVLSSIARNPRLTAFEISQLAGITERSARKIIADLEADRYIEKTKVGRNNRYRINGNLSLRAGSLHDIPVGDFLATLGWQKKKVRKAP
jgi:DNA-binding IclR family transcriptional regulator